MMRIRKIYLASLLAVAPAVLVMCRKAGDFSEDQYDPRLSGGAATTFNASSKAFGDCVTGLSEWDNHIHSLGDAASEATFVAPPAAVHPGLGPIFNNVSCKSCHHNDGKGSPTFGTVTSSMLTRLSLPGTDEHGGPVGVPGFGLQLQDLANVGKQPEGKVNLTYVDIPFTYPDGNIATLHKPTYTILNQYMPLPGNVMLSPRMAPPFFGLGLLENIPENTIKSFADENDADGDGISGRPNYVWDPVQQKMMLGRFGMKANTATLLTQTASAYQQDMGVTSYVFPQESSTGQLQFDGRNDDPELPDSILNAVVYYLRTLCVPARRDVTLPNVKNGEALFTQVGCASCHKPTLYTGISETLPVVSNQRIHPYTDLLLHDLGDGLADGRPDFVANGNEWKTPALWGVGLFEKTNGTPYYLHDGRARSLEEAILWHSGEAERSKQAFVHLASGDRQALIIFLKSL